MHQHYDRGSGHSGYGCVHDDAELTVIRIGFVGVQVSNLGHGQHGQQGKAQPRDRSHQAAARAEINVQMCPKSCQKRKPTV